ncbi:MAG: single-stranded DNA-binding protein [Candidatus Ornithomonoglobus sp.]
MNKVLLVGRMTADPELRQTPQGTAVTRFTVAVDRRFRREGGQQADFITCVAWRQQAEFVCRYFNKGKLIGVEGSIQTR